MTAGKRVSFLPPLLVFALVSSMYVVFLLLHLLPQFRRLNWLQPSEHALPASLPNDPHMYPAPASEVVGLALGFHVAFVFFLASFFQAMATPPGSVPAGDPQWERGQFDIEPREDREVERIIRDVHTDLAQPGVRSLLKRMPIVERKKGKPASLDAHGHNPDEEASLIESDDLKRKCHGCMVYKPDRVHHCQVCGACVLRMDHHCPWVANCVGFRNYKFFLLALFYAIVSMILMIASMLPRFTKVFAPVLDTNYFLRRDLPIAIVFGTACLLLLVIGCFFCFHIYLTTHAMSTIEYREKKNHSDVEVKHRWAVAHVKYDKGSYYENFKHVMGEPYMWLFPVDPRPDDDGTYAKVQPDSQTSSKIL